VPACTYFPIPEYSEEGRGAGITSAWVILTVTVSTKGTAIKIKRSKDAGYGFTEKAIEIVSDWKFRPAGRGGTPVPVTVPVEIRFSST
jgi:TonB family protein